MNLEHETALAHAVKAAAPAPRLFIDPATIIASSNAARRRRRRNAIGVGASVAAMLLVAGVVVVTNVGGTHHGAATGPRAGDNRSATTRAAQQLLAQIKLPAGSQSIDATRYGLTSPSSVPVSDNLIDESKAWLAPGTLAAVKHYIRLHLPGEAKASTTIAESGVAGGRTGMSFELTGSWVRPNIYQDLELQFTLVTVGERVAVRADAMAIYLPPKRDDQRVPTDATGLEAIRVISSTRTGAAETTRRTFDARTARRIADEVNDLRVAGPVLRMCPVIVQETVVTLRFSTASGRITAKITTTSCGASLQLGSGPDLTPTATLTADLKRILG
jgi:hypothetical protein